MYLCASVIVPWNAHGHYEISLDALSVTVCG